MAPLIFLCVGSQPWAAKMVASAQALRYDVVQMSDADTPATTGVHEVIRRPMTVPLMLFRLEHLAHFPDGEWLTVDADVLLKARVDEVWEQDFDVALTHREPGTVHTPKGDDIAARMPWNMGVAFSRCPEFWRDCRDWLLHHHEWQAWYGDQFAVKAVVDLMRYRVLELPCDLYNWVPKVHQRQSNAAIWHYKGRRKVWM